MPQSKLVSKTRKGLQSHPPPRHARTPYRRILYTAGLTKKLARQLEATYRGLNLAQLRRDLAARRRRLLEVTKTKTRTALR